MDTKFKSSYFHYQRITQNKKQLIFEKYLHISSRKLSQMESGKIDFPDSLFIRALKILEIYNFSFDSCFSQLYKELENIIVLLYRFDYSSYHQKVDRIVEQKDDYIHSDAFFLWHLIYLLSLSDERIEKKDLEFEAVRKTVEYGLFSFDWNIQCLYFWVVADYYNKVHNYQKSMEYLRRGIPLVSNTTWDCIEPTLLMLELQNSVKTNHPEEAYYNLPVLRARLLKDQCYRAIAYVDGLETLLLMSLGRYSIAEKKLLYLYDNLNQFDGNTLSLHCFDNLLWCYLLQEKFIAFSDMIQSSDYKKMKGYLPNLVFYPYCLYRLNKYEEAKLWLVEIAKLPSTQPELDHRLLCIQEDLLANREKTFIRHINKELNYYDSKADRDMVRILLKIKCFFYESHNQYQESVEALKEYILQLEI